MTEKFVIQKKIGGVTMKEEKVSERMGEEGIRIDAKFPWNMVLAYMVLLKAGYSLTRDYLHVSSQSNNQWTTVRYLKTVPWEEKQTRHFKIRMPDRYVPAKEAPEGVIRSIEDVFRK